MIDSYGGVEEGLGKFGVLPNKGPILRYSRVRKYRIGVRWG